MAQFSSSPDMTTLLPCPFCGGDNIEIFNVEEGPQAGCRIIECYECFASTGGKLAGPTQDADLIKAWNTRAHSARISEADKDRECSVDGGLTRSSAESTSGDAQIKRAAQETAPGAQVVRSDGDLLVYYAGFNLSKFVRFLALQPYVVGPGDAAQGSAWQPIETAPKDGTDILAVENGVVGEAYFNLQDDNWWWANTDPHDFDPSHAAYPTHWMPLPAAPSLSSTEGR